MGGTTLEHRTASGEEPFGTPAPSGAPKPEGAYTADDAPTLRLATGEAFPPGEGVATTATVVRPPPPPVTRGSAPARCGWSSSG